MVKRKQLEKKKRSTVRERNWEGKPEAEYSHDLVRHRHALSKLSENSLYRNPLPKEFNTNATVVFHSRKWAFVKRDNAGNRQGETSLCLIDERLEEKESTLLAPGDRVYIERDKDGNEVVRGIGERTSTLFRYAPRKRGVEKHLIAANVDVLLIVAAAKHPPFRPGLIDRFLITAQLGGVFPIICLNKMDLVPEPPEQLHLYRDLGIPVFKTSCATGEGIEGLREVLCGKTSVFAGHSGVGKSSLLNALDPQLRAYTREVSEATQRGKHATTAAWLYELDGDICVIDTPGIRTLGLWDVGPEELAFYFPDLAEYSLQCRFRNCTHIHEPGCAVQNALEQGRIAAGRYASYKRIRETLETDAK